MSHKKLVIPMALMFSVAMAAGAQSQQYAPATEEYAPAEHEYAPATQEYAPATQEYAPAQQEYAPAAPPAQATQPATPSASPQATQAQPQQPQKPHEIFAKPQDVEWIILAKETEAFMEKSLESFADKNPQAAANGIRVVSAYVSALAGHATGDHQTGLQGIAKKLQQLASDVGQGTASAKSFEQAFAQAHQVLASYFQNKASQSLAANDPKEAGDFLGATVEHFNNAVEWSGDKSQGGSDSLDDAVDLVGELIEGSGFDKQQASQIINQLGTAVQQLGKTLQPAASQPTSSQPTSSQPAAPATPAATQ